MNARRGVFAVLGAALVGVSLLPWWRGAVDPAGPAGGPAAGPADVWRASSWWAVAVLLGLAGCVVALRRRPPLRWALLLPVLGLGVLAVESAVVLDVVRPRDLAAPWQERKEPVRTAIARIVLAAGERGTPPEALVAPTATGAGGAGVAAGGRRSAPGNLARVPVGTAYPAVGPVGPTGAPALAALLLAVQLSAALLVSRSAAAALPGRFTAAVTGSRSGSLPRAGRARPTRARRVVVAGLGLALASSAALDWWWPQRFPPSPTAGVGLADASVWWLLAVAAGMLAAVVVSVTGSAVRSAGGVALGAAAAVVLETWVRFSRYDDLRSTGPGVWVAVVVLVVLGLVLVRAPVSDVPPPAPAVVPAAGADPARGPRVRPSRVGLASWVLVPGTGALAAASVIPWWSVPGAGPYGPDLAAGTVSGWTASPTSLLAVVTALVPTALAARAVRRGRAQGQLLAGVAGCGVALLLVLLVWADRLQASVGVGGGTGRVGLWLTLALLAGLATAMAAVRARRRPPPATAGKGSDRR